MQAIHNMAATISPATEQHFLNVLLCPAELSVPGLPCGGGCNNGEQAEGQQPQHRGGTRTVPCDPRHQYTRGNYSGMVMPPAVFDAGWLTESSHVDWVHVLLHLAAQQVVL